MYSCTTPSYFLSFWPFVSPLINALSVFNVMPNVCMLTMLLRELLLLRLTNNCFDFFLILISFYNKNERTIFLHTSSTHFLGITFTFFQEDVQDVYQIYQREIQRNRFIKNPCLHLIFALTFYRARFSKYISLIIHIMYKYTFEEKQIQRYPISLIFVFFYLSKNK